MTANANAWFMNVRVRLRVCGANHFREINAVSIGNASELVGEGDVHVAIGRLGEFRHLGGFERLHLRDWRIEHALVEGGRTRQAGGVGATDELRIRGEVAERLAG